MKSIAALVFAVSIVVPAALSAHGDEPHVRGTVVSVTDKTLVVKTTGGASQTMTIESDTKVMRGKAQATLQDVKAGQRVVVHIMKHDNRVMAEEIDLPAALSAKPAK